MRINVFVLVMPMLSMQLSTTRSDVWVSLHWRKAMWRNTTTLLRTRTRKPRYQDFNHARKLYPIPRNSSSSKSCVAWQFGAKQWRMSRVHENHTTCQFATSCRVDAVIVLGQLANQHVAKKRTRPCHYVHTQIVCSGARGALPTF